MNAESYWTATTERVEALRQEAAQQHLAGQAVRANLWARLLPPLRRMEGWLERHARTSGQPEATWNTPAR
jgi:hypothetical protein